MTGAKDLTATTQNGCIDNEVRKHGPLVFSVPNLHWDLVEGLQEVGVKEPSDTMTEFKEGQDKDVFPICFQNISHGLHVVLLKQNMKSAIWSKKTHFF